MYMYGGFSFVLMYGVPCPDHGPSPVVHTVPSEARHARSEATGVVTPNRTQHRLKPPHSTAYRLHTRQTKSLHDTG